MLSAAISEIALYKCLCLVDIVIMLRLTYKSQSTPLCEKVLFVVLGDITPSLSNCVYCPPRGRGSSDRPHLLDTLHPRGPVVPPSVRRASRIFPGRVARDAGRISAGTLGTDAGAIQFHVAPDHFGSFDRDRWNDSPVRCGTLNILLLRPRSRPHNKPGARCVRPTIPCDCGVAEQDVPADPSRVVSGAVGGRTCRPSCFERWKPYE